MKIKTEYLAHLENSELKQPPILHRHLSDVAELADKFISEANPQLAESLRWAGLLHDLGNTVLNFRIICARTAKSKVLTKITTRFTARRWRFCWLRNPAVKAGFRLLTLSRRITLDCITRTAKKL